MAATLTDKTRLVLAELFTRPDQEWTAKQVATATGLAPTVAGNLLGRLIAEGFVTDRRTNDGKRVFALVSSRRAAAAEAAGVTPPPRPTTLAGPRPDRQATLPPGVMTVNDLRAAYARGEVSRDVLDQVERAVAETVKPRRQ